MTDNDNWNFKLYAYCCQKERKKDRVFLQTFLIIQTRYKVAVVRKVSKSLINITGGGGKFEGQEWLGIVYNFFDWKSL